MQATTDGQSAFGARYPIVSVGIILFLVILLLVWHANRSYQVFLTHQQELMLRSINGAENEIELYLEGIQRSLRLFTKQNRQALENLAKNPDNEGLYSTIEAGVVVNFPEYYALSQVDKEGRVIFNDFNAAPGTSCQIQVKHFAGTGQDLISLHRHPEGNHFDIMASGRSTDDTRRIFILSILTESLGKILKKSQVPGQRLLILHQNNPGLIEIAAASDNSKLSAPQQLRGDDRARITIRRPLPNTLWDLVVLQDLPLLRAQWMGIAGQVFIALVGFFSVSLVLISLIKQEERRRIQAERRLSASHKDLTRLVNERTEELHTLNNNLEKEIVERKMAQEQARQQHESELGRAWRLNTMGEMAVELAHEISQPLAAISNYTRGCIRRLRKGPNQTEKIIHALEQAADQAELAGRVIHRFRGLLRKEAPKHQPFDLNRAVREVIDLVKLEADRAEVVIHWHPLATLPSFQADRIQIAQVIINLLRNGIDALSEGQKPRRLTIETSYNDSQVQLKVEDNGKGLLGQDPEQLFQRFFTTKPNGMGMGLAIGRSIVESHGGSLWAEEAPEGGAVFLFRLPI